MVKGLFWTHSDIRVLAFRHWLVFSLWISQMLSNPSESLYLHLSASAHELIHTNWSQETKNNVFTYEFDCYGVLVILKFYTTTFDVLFSIHEKNTIFCFFLLFSLIRHYFFWLLLKDQNKWQAFIVFVHNANYYHAQGFLQNESVPWSKYNSSIMIMKVNLWTFQHFLSISWETSFLTLDFMLT